MKKLIIKYNKLSLPLRASTWFVICKFFQKGISLITTPIFTRLLNPEEYGIVSVYYSWYDIILVFTSLSLAKGVYNNGLIKYKDDSDKFTSSMQGLTSLLTLIAFTVYYIFRNVINKFTGLETILFIVMFGQLMFINGFDLWSTKEKFNYKYKMLIAITLTISILAPSITVCFLLNFNSSVVLRIIPFAFVQIIIYFIIYIFNFIKGKTICDLKYWKFALTGAIPLIPHFLSQVILNSSDKIIINYFIGYTEAGIYAVAYSAATLLTLLNTSINSSLVPWTYKKINSNDYSKMKSINSASITIVFVLNILLIIMAPEFMKIFASSDYSNAIWIIPPVVAGVYFSFISSLFVNLQIYTYNNKIVLKSAVGISLLNIILNIVFIPIGGYLVAGYTTMICYLIQVLIHYFNLKKNETLKYDLEQIFDFSFMLKISVLFVVIMFCCLILYKIAIVKYIIILIIFVISFFRRKFIYLKLQHLLKNNKETNY